MSRSLLYLFIVIALLLSQQAAQMHAVSHVGRDLARAERGGKIPLPLGHPAEQCIAFHAIDSAMPNAALAADSPRIAPQDTLNFVLPLPLPRRVAYDSRAPPVFS